MSVRRGHQGFTLIELVVVMAIVVIMASLAVGYTGAYISRRQVEGAAFQLVQDLRDVQSQAVFTRSYLAVTLDVPNSLYSFERTSGGPRVVRQFNSTTGYASSVLGTAFVGNCVYFTAAFLSTSSAPKRVTFYYGPWGDPRIAPNENADAVIDPQADRKGGVISLASRGGGRIDVRISPVIGQASMVWQ